MKVKLLNILILALLIQGASFPSYSQNLTKNKQAGQSAAALENTPSNKLPVAIFFKNTNEVLALLKQGADVNYNNGAAIFMLAQVPGLNKKVINAVLDPKRKPNPNVRDKAYKNFTPLHFAAMLGIVPSLEGLLKAGAQVNSKNDEGRTPLHLAALASANTETYKADYECAKILVAAGADVTIKDNFGNTALEIAQSGPASQELKNFLKEQENSPKQKTAEEQKKLKELAQSLQNAQQKPSSGLAQ